MTLPTETDVNKHSPDKKSGIATTYLDWWMGHEKPPSYKNLSDNLRAYLTVGAYIVLLKYLWFWGQDRIPAWVFQGTAIIWGAWVLWFWVLTVIQTWHLYLGFCFELIGLVVEPYAKLRTQGEITQRERIVVTVLFLPFALSSLVLAGTGFYVIGAILRGAKML